MDLSDTPFCVDAQQDQVLIEDLWSDPFCTLEGGDDGGDL